VSYRRSPTIEFDGRPTIDELLAALTELKGDHGGDALVRSRGYLGGSLDGRGSYIKAITVELAEQPKKVKP
jgi:hypothetical protein